jgi:hypothetical protein
MRIVKSFMTDVKHPHGPQGGGLLPGHQILGALLLTLVVALHVSAQSGAGSNDLDVQDKSSADGFRPRPIIDTWDVTLTSGDFQQKERYTFVAGRTRNKGSLVFSNEIDAIPPCGTDHGVWQRTGTRRYATTHGAFCVDPGSGEAFTIKWREEITLSKGLDQLQGEGLFEVFDQAGNQIFSATYTLQGSRIKVEHLPEESDASPARVTDGLSKWRSYLRKGMGSHP